RDQGALRGFEEITRQKTQREDRHGFPSGRLAADPPRAEREFYRHGLAGPDCRSAGAGTDSGRARLVRAGGANQLAHAPAWPNALCHLGRRPLPDQGWSGTRTSTRRRSLDSAGRKALARRIARQWHDPYRHAGSARRHSCDLDGAGHRRGISGEGWRIAALSWLGAALAEDLGSGGASGHFVAQRFKSLSRFARLIVDEANRRIR